MDGTEKLFGDEWLKVLPVAAKSHASSAFPLNSIPFSRSQIMKHLANVEEH